MSKQPNVDLSNVTAEHRLGKSTVVKGKRGRPKKQSEASLGGSEGEVFTLQELAKRRLSDMCDDLGRLGKSSDVEQKRSDDRGSRKASIFVPPLCRLLEERGPEHRSKICLC